MKVTMLVKLGMNGRHDGRKSVCMAANPASLLPWLWGLHLTSTTVSKQEGTSGTNHSAKGVYAATGCLCRTVDAGVSCLKVQCAVLCVESSCDTN